jgi:hypothetical protein
MNPIKELIDALEFSPRVIVGMLGEAPREILKRRPAPGEWSIHEQACHLAYVHPLFFERLALILREDHPVITPYNPDVDDAEDALLKLDLDESMARFVEDRQRLIRTLRGLAEQDWERSAEHPEYARYSVYIMFRHLYLHDQMHAYHIEELLLKKEW